MFTKNAAITSVILASTLSASFAFADNPSTVESAIKPTTTTGWAKGYIQKTQEGKGNQNLEKMLTNSGVVAALQNAGITIPSAEEIKAFQINMESARKSQQNLSEANKTELRSLRKSFQKQERDYLRSVGVMFPSESDIEKYQTIQETIKNMKPSTPVKSTLRKEVRKEIKNQMKKPEMKKMMRNQAKKTIGASKK